MVGELPHVPASGGETLPRQAMEFFETPQKKGGTLKNVNVNLNMDYQGWVSNLDGT